MSLASVEAYLSRPIAPTRRIALGGLHLPMAPGSPHGGVLLGAMMARFARDLDADIDEQLSLLLDKLEAGTRVPQPQLRHRLQTDRVGLMKCRYSLDVDGERFRFRFDSRAGSPTQHVLTAAYAGATLHGEARTAAFTAMRKGLGWIGPVDDRFVRFLTDRRSIGATVSRDPVGWALTVLAVEGALDGEELHRAVATSFRQRLIEAHPDHGGDPAEAADRIADLREARRILLTR